MSHPQRIAATFAELQAKGRKALIPYVTAGFPFADITPALMLGMVEAGADVIELGVPFSDPMADGPVIQKAGEKALALGIGLAQVLDMVRTFRQRNDSTPVVLMGYANPVERYEQRHGQGSFARDAGAAGDLLVWFGGIGGFVFRFREQFRQRFRLLCEWGKPFLIELLFLIVDRKI